MAQLGQSKKPQEPTALVFTQGMQSHQSWNASHKMKSRRVNVYMCVCMCICVYVRPCMHACSQRSTVFESHWSVCISHQKCLQRWNRNLAEELTSKVQDFISISDSLSSNTFQALQHHLQVVILIDEEDHILAELLKHSVHTLLQLHGKNNREKQNILSVCTNTKTVSRHRNWESLVTLCRLFSQVKKSKLR